MQTPLNQELSSPLLVKNEGVLVKTDILWESFFILLKRNPLYLFLMPVWMMRGTAHLSEQVLGRVLPDENSLPYNEALIAYLQTQRETGRQIHLVTDLSTKYADKISRHLGLFQSVLSIEALANQDKATGAGHKTANDRQTGYVFACRSAKEIPVGAGKIVGILLVGSDRSEVETIGRKFQIENIIESSRPGWHTCLRAIRAHQWLKNLLVFIPLITAHQVGDASLMLRATGAFVAFSLCASGVYLLNDLLDLPADRKHPGKRKRPLATAEISVKLASLIIPLCTIAGFLIGFFLGAPFLAFLTVYLIVTVLYSLWLKKIVVLDVIILASLYTIRIFAGGAAVLIIPSFWLLSFSMFIFFSLALMKRSSDLYQAGSGVEQNILEGRGYLAEDAPIVQNLGVASGYLSVLVLALYINSDNVRLLYSHHLVLWLVCPLLLYWISRVWLIVSRGRMDDDPVLFTIRDRVSQAIALATLLVLWFAT